MRGRATRPATAEQPDEHDQRRADGSGNRAPARQALQEADKQREHQVKMHSMHSVHETATIC